jgi:predicted flap endonuclease-1-like 5' DNA nuclease
MTNIIDIEGIGKGYAAKLAAAGITTTQALHERGATPKGRQDLA